MLTIGIGTSFTKSRGNTFTPGAIPGLQLWLSSRYQDSMLADGAALFASASSQYLYVSSNSTLQTGDIDYFGALWFKPTSLATYYLFTKHANSGQSDFRITTASDGKVYAQLFVTGNNFIVQASSYTANAWNFVMWYVNKTAKTLNISLNGGSFVSQTYTGIPITGNAELRIGFEHSGAIIYYDGAIDSCLLAKPADGYLASNATAIRDYLYNSGSGRVYADLSSTQKTSWGLVSWWDLDETTGTRNDSHGTNHLTASVSSPTKASGIAVGKAANGNPISQWKDLSGNNRHVSQATFAYRPTHASNALNGLPGITFDGVDDHLFNDAIASILSGTGKPITAFVVVAATNAGTAYTMSSNSANAPLFNHYPFHINNKNLCIFRTDLNVETDLYGETTTSGKPFLSTNKLNATTLSMASNGGMFASSSISTTSITVNRATIGALRRGVTEGYLAGIIYEIIFYSADLNTTQRQQIESYLVDKYMPDVSGLTAAVTEDSTTLTWTATPFATLYYVFFKATAATSWTFAGVTGQTSFTVSGLDTGTAYSFKVQAVWSVP